jgi:agmatinase
MAARRVQRLSEELENLLSGQTLLCKLGIIGFCTDENSSFMRSTSEAPPLIRKALFSASSNLWSESGIDLEQPHIFFDAGDVLPAPGRDMPATIEDSISALTSRSLPTIALGGDHSITYSIIRALSKKHRELSILYIDAHPDLYHEFKQNRYSHACPCARIMEEKLVRRLVQVGIRTMNKHQREQAARFGVDVIEMKEWGHGRALDFDTPVYISIDLDGLDPAFAPGVSHREPGGLSTRQVIDLINGLNVPVFGADIVEFNPRMDSGSVTAMVCAKILKEVAAKMLENQNRTEVTARQNQDRDVGQPVLSENFEL